MEEAKKCGNCQKTDVPLNVCASCKKISYCNRDCQKAHWKAHKKDCSFKPKRSDAKPFTALYNNNFLHDRSKEDTFKILIDVIRMRQEDVYSIEGDIMVGTLYDGESTSEKALGDFLKEAKKHKGFLPPWWNHSTDQECIQFGLTNQDWSLAAAREKSDVVEQWGDPMMPMKLRMLGEKVYGNAPGGTSGAAMMKMMMDQESGKSGMQMSHLSLR